MITPDLSAPIPDRIDSVHFIGIGGSGVSGIAGMFLDAGKTVSGSDRAESANTLALAERGATVSIGHDAAHLPDVDAVVYTGAIWPENPEYLEAKARGIPLLHRSQALRALIGSTRLVSVAGAHGKTTSTGMIITALNALGADPSYVNGGVIEQLGRSSATGSDDLFVIEADESDGTFLTYDTSVALVTNVDADHLDHYGSHAAFDRAFVTFADSAREAVVISSDDPGAQRVRGMLSDDPDVLRRIVTFGAASDADIRVFEVDTSRGGVSFSLAHGAAAQRVTLAVPGEHNAINAAGAVGVLLQLGYAFADAARAVEAFRGTVRRFELHGVERDVSVYDDYAHHPTEVRAALTAARTVVGGGRIIALHQPHTYSRTRLMSTQFADVLEQTADHTVVLDVYGAREDPIPGVTGALVSDSFADPSRVSYEPDWQRAAERAAAVAQPGDFIVTLGCGDVYRIIPQVLDALADGAPASTE